MSTTSTIHTVELPAIGDRPFPLDTLGQALDCVRDVAEWWRIRDADG